MRRGVQTLSWLRLLSHGSAKSTHARETGGGGRLSFAQEMRDESTPSDTTKTSADLSNESHNGTVYNYYTLARLTWFVLVSAEMKTDFCYTQAEVDAAAGCPVSIGDRAEGLDWERRTQGRGTKVWWHKSVYEAFKAQAGPIEVPQEQLEPNKSFREVLEENGHVVREPSNFDSEVQQQKIVRIYPNFKWVETDKGRVWVGLKGANMKRGQIIAVQFGKLFTGKITAKL